MDMLTFLVFLSIFLVGHAFMGVRTPLLRLSHAKTPVLFSDNVSDFASENPNNNKPDAMMSNEPAEEVEESAVEKPVSMVAEPQRQEISNEMRERLRRESQALGGDPNVKGANPILIIGAIIGALVILGGKDILY